MKRGKKLCRKWDSNPRGHTPTRKPEPGQAMSLESSALDHSAIPATEGGRPTNSFHSSENDALAFLFMMKIYLNQYFYYCIY
jgi:hypothetical protein